MSRGSLLAASQLASVLCVAACLALILDRANTSGSAAKLQLIPLGGMMSERPSSMVYVTPAMLAGCKGRAEVNTYEFGNIDPSTIIAREPNGDVIQMDPPSFCDWLKENEGPEKELTGWKDAVIIPTEPNGDAFDMSPPGWGGWLKEYEPKEAKPEGST